MIVVSLDNRINFPDKETKLLFLGLAALFEKTDNFPSLSNLFFFLLKKKSQVLLPCYVAALPKTTFPRVPCSLHCHVTKFWPIGE